MSQTLTTPLTGLRDARARLLAACPLIAGDIYPLNHALGAFVAQDLFALRPSPAVDVALIDGAAVDSAACVGAGFMSPALLPHAPEVIAAGAPLPPGCDAVVDAALVSRDGPPFEVSTAPAPGDGVRRAGGDFAAEAQLAHAGRRLDAYGLAALRLAGVEAVPARRPHVALLAPPPPPGQDASTAQLVAALAEAVGARITMRLGVGRDVAALASLFALPAESAQLDGSQPGASQVDLVLVVGCTGQGADDALIAALPGGADVFAHGLAMAPGRTTAIGQIGALPFVALPGRFDGALAGFLALVAPALRALAGAVEPVGRTARPLTRKIASTVGVAQLVLLENVAEGWAPLATGDICAAHMVRAEAYVVIEEDSEGLAAGEPVRPLPLPGLWSI